MPLPPALRYRLARLKAISRPLRLPAVGGTLAVLSLLAVVVPQYLRHPEWRSQYDAAETSLGPSADVDLGSLSGEDLASLAEIDNLTLLLNQLQPATSTALESPEPEADRLIPPQQAQTEPVAIASPFAQYLERSQFRFSPAASGLTATEQSLTPLENRSISPTSGQRQPLSAANAANTEALPPSPLQQALNNRNAPAPVRTSPIEAEAVGNGQEPISGLTPPPWMVEGRLPGVDQRFIRTTPQMSPPPGTTGYTQPPDLARPALSTPPHSTTAPAALNLDLGAPVAAPAGGSQVRSPAAIDTPVSAPLAQPTTPPFSAPRPPGV
ncbi:MAG: hypothetical protein WBG38_13170, partial [Nodosilinea sp.]